MEKSKRESWLPDVVIGVGVLLLAVVAAACSANEYADLGGGYYGHGGQKYTRRLETYTYKDHCGYLRSYNYWVYSPYYAPVAYEAPKAAAYEAPKKYESDEDEFDRSLGRAIEYRAKADADVDRLVSKTNAQVKKLEIALGGRALVNGFNPYVPSHQRDLLIGGEAYGGKTTITNRAYNRRETTRYTDVFGTPSDTEELTRAQQQAAREAQALAAESDARTHRQIQEERINNREVADRILAIEEKEADWAGATDLLAEQRRQAAELKPKATPRTRTIERTTEDRDEPVADSVPPAPPGFPMLNKYCTRCHGGESAEKGLLFDGSKISAQVAKRGQLAVQLGLRRVSAKIAKESNVERAMPPKDAAKVDQKDASALEAEIWRAAILGG